MRTRKKPGAEEILKLHSQVIDKPRVNKGRWQQYFQNEHPMHIEIGCGKGKFLTTLAERHPHINFIGIERQPSILISAVSHLEQKKIENIGFVCGDVQWIEDFFMPGEIQRIYINFCDPWPKKRWAKRRLTHHSFLQRYERLFENEGEIHFKTDNQNLFEFSINTFSEQGWRLKNIALDLHKGEYEQNVMTEYEEKFSAQGMPIFRCEAIYRKGEALQVK